MIAVTCTAPVNIAVIKYWGKRDEKLILPINSSLSGTLNQNDMKTTTTVVASPDFDRDRIWLNGREEDIQSERIQRVLDEIRKRAGDRKEASKEKLSTYKVHIVTVNNFPTAAGLASSASGYCCLVYTLAQVFQVSGDISTIARVGSGSACRSIYGGWVAWDMGNEIDGSDSRARQVADEHHWKEMRVLVLVVNDKKKETSSTAGMQNSVETSKLIQERVKIVPGRMAQMEKSIADRDYETFGQLTMRDSDDFHAVCADTQPPIFYMNETSKRVVDIVKRYNRTCGKTSAAYTFDAGPNPVIYLLEEHVSPLLSILTHFFPSDEKNYVRNVPDVENVLKRELPKGFEDIEKRVDGLKSGPDLRPCLRHRSFCVMRRESLEWNEKYELQRMPEIKYN
ncbi:hypothetical protein PROFUN_10721 [Planoprotostelium fungivorum]|uniref:Diphosphomevalonate decarboxylase n=1 Tax=Planoprotostelium fungivorum TaxID=1890364 RepID=A0A2P6N9N2_9EUKA|nr:hypothetical protein PROFUN_10721 [Planoprotostelium fungivorum]